MEKPQFPNEELTAKQIYVVMRKNFPLSRNIRIQWFFRKLNTLLHCKNKNVLDDNCEDFHVVSIIPNSVLYDEDLSNYCFKIIPTTLVTYLSHKYSFVFCLDLSPSIAIVDIQRNEAMIDEILRTLEICLKYLIQPFYIPGTQMLFQPQLFVTVIAHVPCCTIKTQKVLIQGWHLKQDNMDFFFQHTRKQVMDIEEQIVEIMQSKFSYTKCMNNIGNEEVNSSVSTSSSETDFVALIYPGILATHLLPEVTSTGIIVITDGIINISDMNLFETVLSQLRGDNISCSFLQLSTSYHPHYCFGYAPYSDLMKFIALATCGTYIKNIPSVNLLSSSEMSCFHQALLTWSFQLPLAETKLDIMNSVSNNISDWNISNPYFYSNKVVPCLEKKHQGSNIHTSLFNVLSCRLKEGYLFKNLCLKENNHIEVTLLLPWKFNVNVLYVISTVWPLNLNNQSCHYEVKIEGDYEFLHDFTNAARGLVKNFTRLTVIKKFWSLLHGLSQTDHLLGHLQSFSYNAFNYSIPESMKNGVPLFSLTANLPTLYSSDFAHPQFQGFWKPVCMLDVNIWQKWMHAHQINLLLEHDQPLPKHLHVPNSSGRYHTIQCRQALASLQSLFAEWCSFILVENHSYVKFIYNENDKPFSFCIIRLTSKPPCAVVRMAFLGGTSTYNRQAMVTELKQKILSLSFPQRPVIKDTLSRKGLASSTVIKVDEVSGLPHLQHRSQSPCCIMVKKQLDKILIRYEKIPKDFWNIKFSSNVSPVIPRSSHLNQTSISNIHHAGSQYLQCHRWIWAVQNGSSSSDSLAAVGRILNTLIKIRLQENFRFAYSHSGIINMVLEIELKQFIRKQDEFDVQEHFISEDDKTHHCLIQYVLFPPHLTTGNVRESISEDDCDIDSAEVVNGELQLINECWIEPQIGTITNEGPNQQYFHSLSYQEVAQEIFQQDSQTISTLVAFEHLNALCLNKTAPADFDSITHNNHYGSVQYIPFSFSLKHLLPKCHQIEFLFSTFIQELTEQIEAPASENGDALNTVDINAANNLLLELLYEHLGKYHDREIFLSMEDNFFFPLQVTQRERDVKIHPVPFLLPEFYHNIKIKDKLSDLRTKTQEEFEDDEKIINASSSATVHWKCFVKSISSTHIILTFIPASFDDLKKLTIKNEIPLAENSFIRQCKEKCDCSSSECNILPTDGLSQKILDCNKKTLSDETADESLLIFKKNTGSITLPLYVYECSFASLFSQLVYKNKSKIYKDLNFDFTFKHKIEIGEDTVTLRSDTQSSETSKQASPEPRSEEPKLFGDKFQVKSICNAIEMTFLKCFVIGIFKNLQLNRWIHPCDVRFAIDDICCETLLEIDIANFLQTVCKHIRDFKVKSTLESLKCSHSNYKPYVSKADGDTNEANRFVEKDRAETEIRLYPLQRFPLTVIQSQIECCPELHKLIKKKFTKILQKSFLPIPFCEEFFFYCPPNFQQIHSKTELFQGNEVSNLSSASDDDHESETFKSETVEFRSDHGSTSLISNKPTRLTTNNTPIGIQTTEMQTLENDSFHLSVADSDSMNSFGSDKNENNDAEDNIPPLFIHLMCTTRSKVSLGSCSVRSIPTCLGEIVDCLDTTKEEIDLHDLQITLDINCLTLPPDLEIQLTGQSELRTTSFCSISPVSSENQYPFDNQDSSSSDEYHNEIQSDQLGHLPEFQHRAVINAVEEIKWMLRDEIASSMLDFYPVTKTTLEMVASHVESSPGRPGCVLEEVPLHFVFGPDQSLDKFIQEFKQMSLTGYSLKEEGKYYFLVFKHTNSTKEQLDCRPVNVGLASKFLLIQTNPHADDGTELRQIRSYTDIGGTSDESFQLSVERSNIENRKTIGKLKLKEDDRRGSLTGDDTEIEECKRSGKVTNRVRKISKSQRDKRYDQDVNLSTGNEKNEKSEPEKQNLNKEQMEAISNVSLHDNALTSEMKKEKDSNVSSITSITKSASSASLQCLEKTEDYLVEEGIKKKLHKSVEVSKWYSFGAISSTPVVASDVSSLLGSGQCSNEDGYEGDSSDIENESDWQSDIEIQQPLLPKFWLILRVFSNCIKVFFHSRETEECNEELQHWKDVVRQVIKNIKNICKIVNQTLLLQDLHETRMCNQLLEPEGSEDIWRHDEHLGIRSKRSSFDYRYNDDDVDNNDSYHDSFLKANLDFKPGTFSCNVVWQIHFILHPRLKTGPGRTGVSRGIQALRTVLNSFSVNNRENMFVYAESSGSVFYLRLNESQCPHTSTQQFGDSTPGSRSLSMVTLPVKKGGENEEELTVNEMRPRVNSASDRDYMYDTSSITSRTSFGRPRMEDSIQLLILGIGEAGPQIKEELVKVLQNRLDEAVLDVISVTLFRNPMCKLTKEDIQFLQRPNETPKTMIHFTINAHALPYLQSVGAYLRQNLLQFLNIPKYIDNKVEHHFQDYSSNGESTPMKEGDVFLYNRPQGSGNKGVAVIAVAIVDGMGKVVDHVNKSKPHHFMYKESLSSYEFEALTATAEYDIRNSSTCHPGPLALIQIRIWERGKVDIEQLTEKLKKSVQHSLADVVMEYHLLTVPFFHHTKCVESTTYSEPVTPVKFKYSSLFLETSLTKTETSPFTGAQQVRFKELSSSFPDLAVKQQSPEISPKDFNKVHKLCPPNVPFSSLPSQKEQDGFNCSTPISCESEKDLCRKKLHNNYAVVMKEWLEYAFALDIPSISKHKFFIESRHSVKHIIGELHSVVKNSGMNLSLQIFSWIEEENNYQHIEVMNKLICQPGHINDFIILGRDDNHWKSIISHLNSEITDVLHTYHKDQKCSPVIQPLQQTDDYNDGNSIFSQPCETSTNSLLTDNVSSTADRKEGIFVPRQILLYITIHNKEMIAYTYNWMNECLTNFVHQITRLIKWHNIRSDFLSSMIVQKLGLFYNQPISRTQAKLKTHNMDDSAESMFCQSVNEIELFKLTTPPVHDAFSGMHPQSRRLSTTHSNTAFLELLRDTQPVYPFHEATKNHSNDIFLYHIHQLKDIVVSNQKEQKRKMGLSLQNTGNHGTSPLTDESLQLLCQQSRIEHYCLTPLLFLPQWRWQIAAARDYTLPSTHFNLASEFIVSKASESRHSSGGSTKGVDNKGRRQSINLPILQSMQSSPRIIYQRTFNEEIWHTSLCLSYIQEFSQFLQNLGFVPLQTRTNVPKRRISNQKEKDDDLIFNVCLKTTVQTNPSNTLKNNVIYMQKTLLGGSLIILELKIIEPYFTLKMFAIEGSRLPSSNTRFCTSQFLVTFVDECDKLKILIHLHSFTYDYHLRSIHSYISGRQLIFRQGYHLTSFLDDFVKYYQKSPNFSWNLIHQDILAIDNLTVPADQLYNHLLDHDKLYGMQVLRMVPIIHNDKESVNEYVLVHLSSQKVSYKDVNDVRRLDDFDISLLISQDNSSVSYTSKIDPFVIILKYYIILTSRRELYPRVIIDEKIGKFRRVTTATPLPSRKVSMISVDRPDLDKLEIHISSSRTSFSGSDKDQAVDNASRDSSLKDILQMESSSAPLPSTSSLLISPNRRNSASDTESISTTPFTETNNRTSLGIRQESVNYLGYFSTMEELMNQIMMEQAQAARERIRHILEQATTHWRRDSLWKRLLYEDNRKKKDDVRETSCGLMYNEFCGLLELLSMQSLSSMDARLGQFRNMHISWYQGLIKLLINKFSEDFRYFAKSDGTVQHMVILNPNFNDHLILLSVDNLQNKVNLCSVLRKYSTNTESSPESCDSHEQDIRNLIEDFINVCCFHLWSIIL